jgi:oligoribonuclease NrnB/cAMP/cGMP phosphodiesterase (DHH superfamily)
MRIRILYHDRCFDGAASAALLGRFLQEYYYPEAEFVFRGVLHRPGFQWASGDLDGDENAIVDFRYCPDPRLGWWFDHHLSAFLSKADEDQFRRNPSRRKVLDVTRSSCAGLIDSYLRRDFQYSAEGLQELIHWADIIDGAKYPTPEAALDLNSPVARLRIVIENAEDEQVRQDLVRKLRYRSIGEVLEDPAIRRLQRQCADEMRAGLEFLIRKLERRGQVVFLDLRSRPGARVNKFLPYCVFRDAGYALTVLSTGEWFKISLGRNPWARRENAVNLAEVAEAYGGGGHSAVAGIGIPAGEDGLLEKTVNELIVRLNANGPA